MAAALIPSPRYRSRIRGGGHPVRVLDAGHRDSQDQAGPAGVTKMVGDHTDGQLSQEPFPARQVEHLLGEFPLYDVYLIMLLERGRREACV